MISIAARVAGIVCICYWAYVTLYGGAVSSSSPFNPAPPEFLSLFGFEFSHEQLKSALYVLLLPLGLLLWAFGDYRPHKTKNKS